MRLFCHKIKWEYNLYSAICGISLVHRFEGYVDWNIVQNTDLKSFVVAELQNFWANVEQVIRSVYWIQYKVPDVAKFGDWNSPYIMVILKNCIMESDSSIRCLFSLMLI